MITGKLEADLIELRKRVGLTPTIFQLEALLEQLSDELEEALKSFRQPAVAI